MPVQVPSTLATPLGLAQLYGAIGQRLLTAVTSGSTDALGAISRLAVHVVPGAQSASVTWGHPRRLTTVGPTDALALAGDKIQYELNSGPCVDAVLHDTVSRVDDLPADERWPEFGRRAHSELGVHSMLAFRFYLEADGRIAGLNLYSTEVNAFDDDSETIGRLLATHGALAVAAARANEKAANLTRALESNREIGVAIGILMHLHHVTREGAFDLLRIASQHSNRKLIDIATEVADQGTIDLPTQDSETAASATG